MSADPHHTSDNGLRDDAQHALDRACDAALFGDLPSDEERRAARALGIELDQEIEAFERIAARLEAERFESESRRAPSSRSLRPRATGPSDEMPPALRARLVALADALHAPAPISIEAGRRAAADAATAGATASDRGMNRGMNRATNRTSGLRDWLIAAACIAFGAASSFVLLSRGSAQRDETPTDPAQFVSMHPNSVRWAWKPAADPHVVGNVRGEAIFDPRTQQGLLVIEGLAANDPGHEQYQLWIFDAERDERYPVDGGVFDVPACGKAAVPIRAKLSVSKPTLLAVTVEKPGGAVVSDRRIAIVAQP